MNLLPPGFTRAPFAHRGLHDAAQGRVENSRAAVDAAMRAGFGVEIDVRLSADGEAMVFHDATLDRLTDRQGPLAARDAAALRAVPLAHCNETIPTLSDILALANGRAPLLVEIKDMGGSLSQAGVGRLEKRVAALLDRYAGPVAVMAFNPASMGALRAAAPALPRGLVSGSVATLVAEGAAPERAAALAALADFETQGACFLSHEAAALPAPRVAALRAAGAAVLCWTIRSEATAQAVRPHVDAITFEGFLPNAAQDG